MKKTTPRKKPSRQKPSKPKAVRKAALVTNRVDLVPAQRKRIYELRRDSYSLEEIANRLSIGVGDVSQALAEPIG